jgi:hypothetical protein
MSNHEQRPKRDPSEVNNLILKILSAWVGISTVVFGWAAKEVYQEVRSSHDAVMSIRHDYDLAISKLQNEDATLSARVGVDEKRIDVLEVGAVKLEGELSRLRRQTNK